MRLTVDASRSTWLLQTVCLLFCLIAFLSAVATANASVAGRIDNISPSAALQGDTVTINGIGFGFGGSNVRVSVGGRLAQVVSATGNKVTFVVPQGVGAGPTTVTATNPGGHSGSIALNIRFAGRVTLKLDEPRHVSAVIGRSGGVVSVVGSDGSAMTLRIPAGALARQETIRITPVQSINGSPFAGGHIAAVHFEPEGLL